MSNTTNSLNSNYQLQKTILIFGMISISLIIIFLILIIIYCICKNRRESVNEKNHNILIEEQAIKNNINQNNNNPQNKFKKIPNSSTIGSDNIRQNMSLSEIKEKNLKDEIHNIIHSANPNNESERKKKKKKNGKKMNRNDSPRNYNNNDNDSNVNENESKNKKNQNEEKDKK